MRALFLTALVAASGAGCATASARTDVAMPELVPPPPPPRVIAVSDPPVSAEPPPDPAESPAPGAPVGRRDAPPARPPSPSAPAPPAPRPVPPSLTLTPVPGTETQTEASIRALVAQAGRDLARVNYAALDTDRRTQYDTARRFVQQAEAALAAGNLVFAGKLADKAATMAAVLVR